MDKMLVGIIGRGFVGSAVMEAFDNTIISDPAINDVTVADVVAAKPNAIFVCVPTPQGDDGSVDGSIVKNVVNQIPEGQLTLVKSTITPVWLPIGKPGLVYNPEFLTQANHLYDFINPDFHVFGGSGQDIDAAITVYQHSKVNWCPYYSTDIQTACFVKYAVNSFLATKVSFMNELHALYTSYTGNDWSQITNIISADSRIGHSHLNVPNNGEYGFGGECFPKDTSALASFAEAFGCNLTVLQSAIDINKQIRGE